MLKSSKREWSGTNCAGEFTGAVVKFGDPNYPHPEREGDKGPLAMFYPAATEGHFHGGIPAQRQFLSAPDIQKGIRIIDGQALQALSAGNPKLRKETIEKGEAEAAKALRALTPS